MKTIAHGDDATARAEDPIVTVVERMPFGITTLLLLGSAISLLLWRYTACDMGGLALPRPTAATTSTNTHIAGRAASRASNFRRADDGMR
jgi:hypothetical protein